MKIIKTRVLLFIMGVILTNPLCQAQFSAELANVKQGNKKIYKIQSDGSRYRYDFEEDGMKGIVIVDPGVNRTAILLPENKYVRYTETTSGFSRMMDPYQAFIEMKERFTPKIVGTEKILGFDSQKLELYANEKRVITAWYSQELGFLIKMLYDEREDTYVELTNIKQEEIDINQFIVPDDYIEVDDQMRPIIPEPPPPDSWNKLDVTLPIKDEFKRGDLITFKISDDKYHKILLKNGTTDPSKTIWRSMRDGTELPDNEQGPLKWRTKRLYGSESSSNTYDWKVGDTIIIEIHEGVMQIEIVVEK